MQSVDFFDDRDDVALLEGARAGDSRCADVLWVRVRPAALLAARGIAANQHDAEDLASEAMTKVFAAIARGQGPSESVLPYLYTTMRNLHISALRRQARVGTPLELDEQRVLNLVVEEPDAIESELVTRAFKNLPARWRYVLWAGLVEGRSGGEVADVLGIKPAAVHALKARALEGLRQQYLTEHAQLSEEQECAAVHRVLASLARGRTRRSTDLTQVWRHLRACEHCAEGYREITAINNRIGVLLGPAAATLVGFAPHQPGAALLSALRLPVEASKVVAAAGFAGAVAVAGTVLTLQDQPAPAAASTAPASAATGTSTPSGTSGAGTPVRRPTPARQPSPGSAGTAAPACRPVDLATRTTVFPRLSVEALHPRTTGEIAEKVADSARTAHPCTVGVPSSSEHADRITDLVAPPSVEDRVSLRGSFKPPVPEPALPTLVAPDPVLLQP
ncbi:MAG: sigma-70 family RNA polymerase sigma factor [Propionibacteriales bacterium]|nr:sigma-70 family RNA polymerase sigma factor [Propionibacteriales bacterium]